jgi:hypothetical protein
LSKNKIDNIFILDELNIVKNNNNLFYLQLLNCLKKYNNKNNNNKITVYRNTKDTVVESVYWKYKYPEIKLGEEIQIIDSPIIEYDEFKIVKIEGNDSFLCDVHMNDLISKNIFTLEKEPGIVIEPVDRINIIF